MTSLKWDRRFLEMAELVASWSKDRRTRIGAVVVDSKRRVLGVGYNGIPRGVRDEVEGRHVAPEKYDWFEHAEANAILQAPRGLDGCTLYVLVGPCPACARMIVQSGITEVVTPWPEHWPEGFRARWASGINAASRIMFQEAGVEWRQVSLDDNHKDEER